MENHIITEVVRNKKIIHRAFETTGISLRIDVLRDYEKMYFQCQDPGVPDGFVYT